MSNSSLPCMRCQGPIAPELVQCPHCGYPLGSGEAPEAWMGETLHNKYLIEEILGVGGMGMVFRAQRLLIGDEVALKILFPKYLKSDLQRRLFRDEAISTAQLDHPNVIRVYDSDIDEEYGVAYIAMELLEGFSFKELMLSEAPMAPERLYPIFTQICDGLSAAHQASIIHRDLKPDNLFLCEGINGEFDVKVLDFGIATMAGQIREDEANKLLGTLRYMAPEQCRGEVSSPQTDLYALGVILYESLTRQRASGKSIEAVLYDEVIPPSKRLPPDQALPQKLEGLIMSLLSKSSSMRPRSALEIKATLELLANPLSAALKTPAPSQMSYNAFDQLADSLHNPKRRDDRTYDPYPQPEGPWDQVEHTPIVDAPLKSISIMWYLLPISLLVLLVYLILNTFK